MTITRARLEEIIHAAGLEPCDYEEVYSSIKTGEIVSMARLALTVLTTAPLSFEEEQQYAAYFMRSRGRPDLLARHSMPYRETYEERIAHRERCDGTLTNEGIMPIDMLSAALRNAPLAPSDNRGWNACRAAMLNHSESERDMVERVSQPNKLPVRVTNALTLSLQAMEFLGDTLNNLDAVCTEDVEFIEPAFEAVRAVLAGDFRENENSSTKIFREIAETSTNSPVIPDGSEDTKRLDWLDAQNKRLNEYYGTSYGWKFDANFQRNAMMLNDSNYPVMTVRQAIDQAIAAAPQQEGN